MKTREELISAFKEVACRYRKVAIQENLREFRTLAWVLGVDDASQYEITDKLSTEEEIRQYIDRLFEKEPLPEQEYTQNEDFFKQMEEKVTGAIVRRLEERVSHCYELERQNRAAGVASMASIWSTRAMEATMAVDMIQQRDYELEISSGKKRGR